MSRLSRVAAMLVAAAFAAWVAQAAADGPLVKINHRRALLVGINEYKHFRKLTYCGSDVEALAKRLMTAGFDADKVVVIHDAATRSLQPDREKIVGQITLLLDSADPDDLLFLAFTGHGVRIQGKSYLVPYAGEIPKSEDEDDVRTAVKTLISLDWIYEKLEQCRASAKLLLVDACQNRLFEGDQRSVARGVALGQISESFAAVPKGVLLLTACAPGEVSHEAETLRHGVYTYYLLEALEGKADVNHDGVVSLREADLYASSRTEQFVRAHFNTTQRPSFKGELEGDVPLALCQRMEQIVVPDDIDKLDVALQRVAEGGRIIVKPGVYRYSTPLQITGSVTISGAGSDPRETALECDGGSALASAHK